VQVCTAQHENPKVLYEAARRVKIPPSCLAPLKRRSGRIKSRAQIRISSPNIIIQCRTSLRHYLESSRHAKWDGMQGGSCTELCGKEDRCAESQITSWQLNCLLQICAQSAKYWENAVVQAPQLRNDRQSRTLPLYISAQESRVDHHVCRYNTKIVCTSATLIPSKFDVAREHDVTHLTRYTFNVRRVSRMIGCSALRYTAIAERNATV